MRYTWWGKTVQVDTRVFACFVELGFIPCTRNTADETLAAVIAEGAGNICQTFKAG
jgi:hypothetical protein